MEITEIFIALVLLGYLGLLCVLCYIIGKCEKKIMRLHDKIISKDILIDQLQDELRELKKNGIDKF
jgi:hypothetical protein